MKLKRNLAQFEQKAVVLWRNHASATGNILDSSEYLKPRTYSGFGWAPIGDVGLEAGVIKPRQSRLPGVEVQYTGEIPSGYKDKDRENKIKYDERLLIKNDWSLGRDIIPGDWRYNDLMSIGVSPPLTEQGTVDAGEKHFEAGDNRTAYLAMALAEAYADGVSVDLIPGHFS